MKRLETICKLLALQRSQSEREIAAHQLHLRSLRAKIETLEAQISEPSTEVSADDLSEAFITNTILLEKWRLKVSDDIKALELEKTETNKKVSIAQRTLKEILVKEDVILRDLEAKRRVINQDILENTSATRLETWIISK